MGLFLHLAQCTLRLHSSLDAYLPEVPAPIGSEVSQRATENMQTWRQMLQDGQTR